MDAKTNKPIHGETKMSELILSDSFIILILERFGIELGIKDKSIDEICKEYNINSQIFLMIVNLHKDISVLPDFKFTSPDIITIIQYLKKSHEYYLEELFPEAIENIKLLRKINANPEILMVESFFKEYKNEVDKHLNYENNTVFPYISNLLDKKLIVNRFSIKEYIDNHDDIESSLSNFRKLLIQHIPSKNDLKVRRRILVALSNLEFDLNVHTKIENDIVIPFVLNIESEIKSR